MDFDKKLFIKMLYETYISKHMSNNIYLHIEFFKTLKHVCKEKKTENVLKHYDAFKKIYYANATVVAFPMPMTVTHDAEQIKRIVAAYNEVFPALDQLRPPVLKEEIYALLNFVYGSILRGDRIKSDDVLACISFMLSLKQKDIGNTGNITITDIIFNILTHVSKLMDEHMHRFVMISRELMYFRSNKKIILERSRLLITTVYIMIHNMLDRSKIIRPKDREPVLEYLFVLCERDEHVAREIDSAAALAKSSKVPEKKVTVDKAILGHFAGGNSADIIEMSG